MDLIKLIINNEMCVGDLALKLNISQPKVSMLLKELRDIKLVLSRIDGKKRYYSVDIDVLNSYINDIKKVLSDFQANTSNEIIIRRKVLFSN